MLVLKRREGQWVEVTHHSGDMIRIRLGKVDPSNPGSINLTFDDSPRNFEIQRPERKPKPEAPKEIPATEVIDA